MHVKLSAYRDVLSIPAVRQLILLGLLVRIPLFGSFLVITLHVVDTLGMDYAAAGLLTTVSTLAVAVSGPWRGRRLDRLGLRRTLAPSLIILPLLWASFPWLPYVALIPLVAVAGLFTPPVFSIVRQGLVVAVPQHRRTALALDSVVVEIGFMLGPALGIVVAGFLGTGWTVLIFEFVLVAATAGFAVANPTMRSRTPDADATEARPPLRSWLTLPVAAVLAASVTATLLLTGTELSVVAALRELNAAGLIGIILAIWGFGSAVGGILYGAIGRPIDAFWLLFALALTTVPVAFTGTWWSMAGVLLLSGFFCAPTMAATVEALTTSVPEAARGEALGWHGSALTGGSALGAPVVGFMIDQAGWPAGFLTSGLLALAVATIGLALVRIRRRRRVAA